MEDENSSDKREYVESKVDDSPPDPSIPSFDLHFDSPTLETSSTVELDVDFAKLYEWVMDGRENKEEIVASLRGKHNVFLRRTNARTIRPRQQIDNSVVTYFGFMLDDSEEDRFKKDVFCLSSDPFLLALYKDGDDKVLAGEKNTAKDPTHFQYNPPNFDKLKLRGKKLVFLPFCYKGHWSLFAMDVPNNKFYILDSLFTYAINGNINKYAANYVVNILTLADPEYSPTPSGPTIEFLGMPKQPNKYDCGLFVMKWMEMWEPSKEMPRWTNDECGELRKALIWRMLFTPENIERNRILKICEDYKVRGKRKPKEREPLCTPEVAKQEVKVLRERKPAASQMTPYATIGTKTLEKVIARQDRPKL
ncbi:hypothetical protein PIB30_081987 [Stylosanthes scabra]|uniref:Ubiquitin-like protease family profile domain-containing protein n=1 Tax=Stylosanthes scabra TaxID=79078 RepID=A0ABU6QT45_9FABA|nr:hypothetical protein [Stylosanthes scabra]